MAFVTDTRVARWLLAGLCLLYPTVLLGQSSGITVRGVVRDSATASPVTGAIVELWAGNMLRSARTDEAGMFRIVGVPQGGYRASIRRIGFRVLDRSVVLAQRDTSIAFTITALPQGLAAVRVHGKGSGIYGVVGNSDDLRPIPGATVRIAGANLSVTTDSAGAFFVDLKKPGTYVVRVSRRGFADEMFPVMVGKDQVVDASRLLEESTDPPVSEGIWEDFDQRLRWRSKNSALVTGADLRRSTGSLSDALQTAEFASRGLRIGPSTCVLLDGVPRPNMPLDAISPDEIAMIEVYASDIASTFLSHIWPPSLPCGDSRGFTRSNPKAKEVVRYVVIWTRR